MNKIYDLLTPYGWLGIAIVIFGSYQIIEFGDWSYGSGSVKIVGGFLILIFNILLCTDLKKTQEKIQ